jgi:hypothetical protein
VKFAPLQVLMRTVLVERVDEATGRTETVCREIVLQRIFTVMEMDLLARAAGLKTFARYGEMDKDVALDDDDAYRHVLVLQKPGQG